MDSGNSGSLQSSSGGSEEYDSRSESISAFLNNNNPSSHIGHGSFGNQPPQQQPPLPLLQLHQGHSSSSMFDSLSNYFDHPLSRSLQHTTTNPNSVLNLDVVWSKNLRSEPNCTDLGGFMAASSSSSPTQQLLLTNQQAQSRANFPSMQINQGPESVNKSSVSAAGDQPNNNMVRNPKKRSRASRRAPTTVLTTDTTNFRAMVQEFTGIPAPPFTSSPFPRTRLDLFGSPSTMRSTPFDPSPPHYLLRPFAQKINPSPFVSSSMVDAIASNPSTNVTNTSSSSTSINYQLPSELGLLKQPQNLLNINMQNPILNFQSLLQAPPKYPLSNSTILGTKPQGALDIPPNDPSFKMGVLEEFGLNRGHVNTNLCPSGLQNMLSSDGALPRNESLLRSTQEHDQSLLRSINGSYNSSNNQRVSNGKASNFSTSSSDFHGDKVPENVATRSEGMVESWLCPSD